MSQDRWDHALTWRLNDSKGPLVGCRCFRGVLRSGWVCPWAKLVLLCSRARSDARHLRLCAPSLSLL